MAKRDIIVVGASAGGVEALRQLVADLPSDLLATIFVVLHIPPYSPSALPSILGSSGPLKAAHPVDGEQALPGHIYVAPPDHHLLVERDRVLVKRGPKENRFRPSIDALFRSAAYVYGPRVIGVILSGALDDGTSGLWTVKRLGGAAIIQQPEDAAVPHMPRNALEYVDADHAVPLSEIGLLLARLVGEPVPEKPDIAEKELKRLALEVNIAIEDDAFEKGIMEWGELTPFTCPECHGILVKLRDGDLARFRCHTGHAFTPSALLAGVTAAVGEMLWQAMRGLEEGTMLLREMAEHFKSIGQPETAELFLTKAREAADHARIVHDSLPHHEQLSRDLRHGAPDSSGQTGG